MKRVFAVRHLAFEDLGSIAALLEARGCGVVYLDAGVDDLSPRLEPDDALIVLGGPIGAYEDDRYPFLTEELRLIERALKQQIPVLGICLGAQLLARALGARVYPGPGREIDIAPVELTPEGQVSCLKHLAPGYRVFHWHGDTFDLPDGAVRLASTAMTPNQAFARGNKVLGLQFHIEAESRKIERWLIGHTCELGIAGLDVAALREGLRQYLPDVERNGRSAIAEWLETAAR
jgi:GMP synthase (glutamine-hydrolysing)